MKLIRSGIYDILLKCDNAIAKKCSLRPRKTSQQHLTEILWAVSTQNKSFRDILRTLVFPIPRSTVYRHIQVNVFQKCMCWTHMLKFLLRKARVLRDKYTFIRRMNSLMVSSVTKKKLSLDVPDSWRTIGMIHENLASSFFRNTTRVLSLCGALSEWSTALWVTSKCLQKAIFF